MLLLNLGEERGEGSFLDWIEVPPKKTKFFNGVYFKKSLILYSINIKTFLPFGVRGRQASPLDSSTSFILLVHAVFPHCHVVSNIYHAINFSFVYNIKLYFLGSFFK